MTASQVAGRELGRRSPAVDIGVRGGANWIQTDPEEGWFMLLRLYNPLPSFFDKSWRAGEIEWVQ